MRIQGRTKDYYDYIGQRFGQDPDLVYVRRKFPQGTTVTWREAHFNNTLKRNDPRTENYDLEFVIAGPHAVTILRHCLRPATYDDPTQMAPAVYSDVILTEAHNYLLAPHWDWRGPEQPMHPRLPQGEKLNELIRLVGAPVFRVRRREGDQLLLDEHVPILGDLGFPAIVSPEQMWQDIYSCIQNVLRKNPDKAPPVEVANEYKIHAAGFDLKTSFRHPVNQKKPKRK